MAPVDHNAEAEGCEQAAAERLKQAASMPADDAEAPVIIAEAHAYAALAASHRTAEQTELVSSIASSGLRIVTGVSG